MQDRNEDPRDILGLQSWHSYAALALGDCDCLFIGTVVPGDHRIQPVMPG